MGSSKSKTAEDRAQEILRKTTVADKFDNRIVKPAPYGHSESVDAQIEKKESVKKQESLTLNPQQNEKEAKPNENELYGIPTEPSLDTTCQLCDRATMHMIDGYMCRVCGKYFHKLCLEQDPRYTASQLAMVDRAFTHVGWSCDECDNNCRLLLPGEVQVLDKCFEQFDADKDIKVNEEEFVRFYQKLYRETEGQEMSEIDEQFERCKFKILDTDNSGKIGYIEFMKHETSNVLLKRDKDNLVRLLTPREKWAAWTMFQYYDVDRDGQIDPYESARSYQQWYTLYSDIITSNKDSTQPICSHVLTAQSTLVDEDADDGISWREFLRNQAIFIISSRPNSAKLSDVLLSRQLAKSSEKKL